MNLPALFLLAAGAATSIEGMHAAPGVPSLVQSGVPEIPAELRQRTDQYLNARQAALVDVTDSGDALLVATRVASTNQLHLVRAPLGIRTQHLRRRARDPGAIPAGRPADPLVSAR